MIHKLLILSVFLISLFVISYIVYLLVKDKYDRHRNLDELKNELEKTKSERQKLDSLLKLSNMQLSEAQDRAHDRAQADYLALLRQRELVLDQYNLAREAELKANIALDKLHSYHTINAAKKMSKKLDKSDKNKN